MFNTIFGDNHSRSLIYYTEKSLRGNAPVPHAVLVRGRKSLVLKSIHACGNRDSRVVQPFVKAFSTVIHGEPRCERVCACVKMLQEYWASTVIFIGIFSQCIYSQYKYQFLRVFTKYAIVVITLMKKVLKKIAKSCKSISF